MVLKDNMEKICFRRNDLSVQFLSTGDIFSIRDNNIMINQMHGNTLDGSFNNIYLRIYKEDGVEAVPLLGEKSASTLTYSGNSICFTGKVNQISYDVTFLPDSDHLWFWKVQMSGTGEMVDVVYAQDIGIADINQVMSNELYNSQYIDHKAFCRDGSYVICSRQNLSQQGGFPYLQQGSMDMESIAYSTDALQFLGLSYKDTMIPEVLDQTLPSEIVQNECAYIALQTRKFRLSDKSCFSFYGYYQKNHAEAIREPIALEEINSAWESCRDRKKEENYKAVQKPVKKAEFYEILHSEDATEDELTQFFPERSMEELADGKLYSFFTPLHSHVVLKEKEVHMERAHGSILMNLPSGHDINKEIMTSTNYMYGIFHSQITIGNTNMNKLLSAARGQFNQMRTSGQRIYIKLHGKYQMLSLPTFYEMGLNYSRWYYKMEDDWLVITAFASADTKELYLEAESLKKKEYEYIITNQLVMGSKERDNSIHIDEGEEFVITCKEATAMTDTYPELAYRYSMNVPCEYSDDRIFYQDQRSENGTLLTQRITASAFRLTIEGILTKRGERNTTPDCFGECKKFIDFYRDFLRDFSLDMKSSGRPILLDKLNHMIYWYAHNAFIHFLVPHGLEQSGGAAWGTRDVCQGPFEFFMATQHFDLVRKMLLEVYAHQEFANGEWPQWFMFDRYPYSAGDCHGDVVFWPLRCIAEYISVSEDITILEEPVPYRDSEPVKMIDHLKRAFETIGSRLIGDTGLISYAGGDWDDTLQPAKSEMKEHLVSAWTQALAYETIGGLAKALKASEKEFAAELEKMAAKMKTAFQEKLIVDGIPAGFVYIQPDGSLDYMLHPRDTRTGIHYRLLPLTRSIISELADRAQADRNECIIEEKLTFPDGVRLMDHPARYQGGVCEFFQRAEQAANVGREISLQYVHAHIRFIQAMAKLGSSKKAWENLEKIIPAGIQACVKNAQLRQANAYFSSSEGDFKTRYEYQQEFERLRTGDIPVKAGWRIYSSGSGILLGNLIQNLCGIRCCAEGLELDPSIPDTLEGLQVSFRYDEKSFTVCYHGTGEGKTVEEVRVQKECIAVERRMNPYRRGAVLIGKEVVETFAEGTEIDVIMG